MKTIEGKYLEILEGFKGYGRKDAEIIFIGLEEAGGGYDNFMTRINTPDYDTKLIDCKKFHLEHLKAPNFHKHNGNEYKDIEPVKVWRFMSYLMLRLNGVKRNKITTLELRKYQSDFLGTKTGNTILAEIYPIPCPSFDKADKWQHEGVLYTRLIPKYASKKEYQEKIEEKRINILNDIIKSNNGVAKAIICYGKSRWKIFKKIFKGIKFENLEYEMKSKKSGRYNLYHFEVGKLPNQNTKIILTPFFGNGAMSDDLMEKLIKEVEQEYPSI